MVADGRDRDAPSSAAAAVPPPQPIRVSSRGTRPGTAPATPLSPREHLMERGREMRVQRQSMSSASSASFPTLRAQYVAAQRPLGEHGAVSDDSANSDSDSDSGDNMRHHSTDRLGGDDGGDDHIEDTVNLNDVADNASNAPRMRYSRSASASRTAPPPPPQQPVQPIQQQQPPLLSSRKGKLAAGTTSVAAVEEVDNINDVDDVDDVVTGDPAVHMASDASGETDEPQTGVVDGGSNGDGTRGRVLSRTNIFAFLDHYIPGAVLGKLRRQRGSEASRRTVAEGSKPVSPKVFFANERTFLSWMQMCLVVGALAVGLLNFGDSLARGAGMVFSAVAAGFMFYALVQFHTRADMITTRVRGTEYEDLAGAVALITSVVLAVGANLVLRMLSATPTTT